MADTKKIIQRKSLGRTELIGSLYNAARDIFCDTTILKPNFSNDSIMRADIFRTEILYDYKDSYKEKFNKLDVEDELKLSVLTGLFTLKGSGKYLTDIKQSLRTVKGTIIYKVTTVEESLDIYHDDIKSCISTDGLSNTDATHIVIGVKWGATTMASFEYKNIMEGSRSRVEEALKSYFKKITTYREGRADINDGQYNIMKYFSVSFLGDVIPHNKVLPQPFDEAKKSISELPLYIKQYNNGKGVPIEYTLYPLSELMKLLDQNIIVRSIITAFDEEAVLRVEQVFDSLSESKQRLNDLSNEAQFISNHQIFNEINNYIQEVKVKEARLRSELAECLVKIRSGEGNINEFESVIRTFQKSILSKDSIIRFIQQYRSVSVSADLLLALKAKKVESLDKDSTIEHILQMHPKNHVFILLDSDKYVSNCNPSLVYTIFRDLCNLNEGLSKFFIIDLKIYAGMNPGHPIIRHYINGEVDSDDYYNDNKELFASNLIYSVPRSMPKHHPSEKIKLEMPCPQVDCSSAVCDWKCLKCKQVVEYGYNLRLYCKCGESKIAHCKFKCNSSYHINGYVPFDLNKLANILPAPPQEETNILLLGETGVGKSTFINAFANYLKFKSLNDAKSGKLETLISSEFSITDDYYNNVIIKIGNHEKNEKFENIGMSYTQECRSHVFHLPSNSSNRRLRLIDTPGIGDTRGLNQDKKNFENILNYISNYKFLNGICIFLKPNNSRLNVVFRFYINELLANLHKNAKDNIVFCFTSTRGTFYRPGDTLPPLKKQLGELNKQSNVEIKVNKDTIYCFDSESFRFLAAFKRGISFTEADEQSFIESWNISVNESSRLIEYLVSRPPHKVKHTLSLNNSRNNVILFSKPLAEIGQLIQINIKLIKEKQKELENSNQTTEELKDRLHILQLNLEPVSLEYPKTVCTNSSCIRLLRIEQTNIKIVDYASHCCPRCNETNSATLRYCSVMVDEKCKVCGCYWDKHVRITYGNRVNIKMKKKSTKNSVIEKCQKKINKLQKEQQKINEISFKFTQFLRQNAIAASNDTYADYLDHFINEEKIKKSFNDDEILNGLEVTKRNYLKEIEVINRAIENNDLSMPQILPKDIAELEQQLYTLKINGSTLKKMKVEAERNQTNVFRYNEKHYVHTLKYLSNFITKVFQKL
ncbi:hypothetical protein C1645_697960 [Glomus cerebriforme]|uniref:Uncharacterized protein n=1 Tax=Glomus cerebriforme TaxID=658196 RepID=A0A397SG54_9GLOM|nr:hypothetical protein C1645_697960 [Glomus cerebriforme]